MSLIMVPGTGYLSRIVLGRHTNVLKCWSDEVGIRRNATAYKTIEWIEHQRVTKCLVLSQISVDVFRCNVHVGSEQEHRRCHNVPEAYT